MNAGRKTEMAVGRQDDDGTIGDGGFSPSLINLNVKRFEMNNFGHFIVKG
jgi:hypothetical protein